MANVLVQESSLQAIAAAIRQRNGTQDTYTPAQMAPAIAAISGGGAEPEETLVFDLDTGYVMSGTWTIGGDTVNYSDVYAVSAGRTYLLLMGATVGTRFRVMFSTANPATASSNITGVSIQNTSNPPAYTYKTYTPESNGYITVTKDNAGRSGLKTYLLDLIDLADGMR